MPATKSEASHKRLLARDRRQQLEDAALSCIARGGIRAFTVDQVAAEAGVSRGLIAHHFGSIEGLLVAVYSRMFHQWREIMAHPRPDRLPIEALIDALFGDDLFGRQALTIWLTLWGEIATNPLLGAEHRAQYAGYRDSIMAALTATAKANGRQIDVDPLATGFICLVDGLGVQRCIEPALLSAEDARTACRVYLEPHLGPLAV
ncbi:MAG: TetR family transcriptional regulator [Cereibacter sphaeroides]|uniref:TetR family transcriptional regulator n=1 Tax=Cereibacter sphaeroides TaxID=1063 RepID=A0A2W5TUZ8_CERSP|nr:MAG: TetR family transcriptional regulator [Cereibacter sphaeroides]